MAEEKKKKKKVITGNPGTKMKSGLIIGKLEKPRRREKPTKKKD